MVNERIPVIVVTGPVGAGKTSTVEALSTLLGDRSFRHAAIDMDHLRWVYPEPNGDRFGMQLGFRNLSAIWPNLLATGVRCAVIADVVESRTQVREYETAMPNATVTVVRLHVALEEIRRRLHDRESAESLEWYLRRAPELQGIMEREDVGDIVIEVGDRAPLAVASEILQLTGI